MRFAGDSDGETRIELPDSWGGKDSLYLGLRDLSVSGRGATLSAGGGPAFRVVRHAPGAELRLRYRVVQTWAGDPAASGANEYRPILRRGYFHVVGNAVFVKLERHSSTRAKFEIRGLPRGWSFASDLEHGPLTIDEVIESVAVAGDFRVLERGPLRVAIRGTWPFTDASFVDRVRPIIASHHRFWGDAEEPFLVTVLPLGAEEGHTSVGGTGRADAFAFFATTNAGEEVLNRTLAHEHLHTWIPRRIGGMPDTHEASDYWLSEGFTDFYTGRLLLRDGIWSLPQYVEDFNAVLRAYALSTARSAPNARVVAEFWKNRDVGQLPYQRGFLLAALWDHRLRDATGGAHGLDDVMRAMKTAAAASAGPPPLASRLFAEQMKALGVDVAEDLERHVERGEPVLLPAGLFGAGTRVETEERPEFHRGFDAEKTTANGNVVTGLDPGSPGYAAGLRDGMKILERKSGKPGDSRVALTYRLMDGDTERIITYRPEGKARVTFQELRLDPALDGAGRRACADRMSGRSTR